MPSELQNTAEIYSKLVEVLVQTFELDPALIKPDANLYTELDIDSIDAIDLLVRLQRMLGRRVKPEAFKDARTVQDVVNAIAALMAEPSSTKEHRRDAAP